MNRRLNGGPAIAWRVATWSQALRFPCGHLEDQPAVTARTRETPRASWVACRCCNLIAVTIAPASSDTSARFQAGTSYTR